MSAAVEPDARLPQRRASIARAVLQTCEGQTSASNLLYDLKHTLPHPDALHDHLQAVLVTGEPERLRGFCRRLQKALERAQ